MKKIFSSVLTVIALLSITSAFAQSPKVHAPLTSTDNGTTLTVCYDISGLGNITSVEITCAYSVSIASECNNPGSSTGPVPGQSKMASVPGETKTVPVQNGRATGCFTTETVFTAGKCPNNKWTGTVTDVTFSNISLSLLGKTFPAPNPQ
jgi:hypothetical protein